MPAWYREHGGCVLTSSIAHYCYLAVRYLPPFFEHRHRVAWSELEQVDAVTEIRHPAVRAILKHFRISKGLSVTHDGDLPARSGLGSSSAFTVGLLHAIHALKGEMPTKVELAREAVYIEQEAMREVVGIQDQIECAHGGLNLVEISGDGSWVVRPVLIKPGRRAELEKHLLLYYTGIQRHSSEIQSAAGRGHSAALHDIAAMVPEALKILTGRGSILEFGSILDRAFLAKSSLSPLVAPDRVRQIYERARRAGAIGGKILGAGGGGFLLLFARPEGQPGLRRALRDLVEVPFRFESEGTRVMLA